MVEHTNEYNRAIVQYPADDEYNPSGFSKVVWTEPEVDGSFFYCSVNFGKEDALSADVDTTSWDASEPDSGGCGGFAWTRMARSEVER